MRDNNSFNQDTQFLTETDLIGSYDDDQNRFTNFIAGSYETFQMGLDTIEESLQKEMYQNQQSNYQQDNIQNEHIDNIQYSSDQQIQNNDWNQFPLEQVYQDNNFQESVDQFELSSVQYNSNEDQIGQENLQSTNSIQSSKKKYDNCKNKYTKNCPRDYFQPFINPKQIYKYQQQFLYHGISQSSFSQFCKDKFNGKFTIKNFQKINKIQSYEDYYKEASFLKKLIIENFINITIKIKSQVLKPGNEEKVDYQLKWFFDQLQEISY